MRSRRCDGPRSHPRITEEENVTTTIPDEVPLDLPRLAELVLDQGQLLADLTAQVAALRECLRAVYAAAGVPGPDALGAQVGAVADTMRRAYQAERLAVPAALLPARAALTVLQGGAR
jgi:hypothetical protein